MTSETAPGGRWGTGAYAEGRVAAPNHSPLWAPDQQPTLRIATEAAASAVFALLRRPSSQGRKPGLVRVSGPRQAGRR